jgi:DNA replication and repair protein RecF
MFARQATVTALAGPAGHAYASLAPSGKALTLEIVSASAQTHEVEAGDAEQLLRAAMADRRREEVARGLTLVGPHRDDLLITLGDHPAKGYASHGESWSCALALRLGSYELLRDEEGGDPVLLLDDVFAELDVGRRERLAELVAGAEQVIVTAAVPADVPALIDGARLVVTPGEVRGSDD